MLKKIVFFIGLMLSTETLTPHLFGATNYERLQAWEAPQSLNAYDSQKIIREFHDLFPTLFDDPQNDPWYVSNATIARARLAVQVHQRVIECHNTRHENIQVQDTTPRLTRDTFSVASLTDDALTSWAQGGLCGRLTLLPKKQKANFYRLVARCGLLGAGCLSTAYVLYNKAKKELIAERTKKTPAAPSDSVEKAALTQEDDTTDLIKAPTAQEVIARVLHNIRTKPLKEQISIRNVALFFTLCAAIESGFKLYAIHLMRSFK